MKKTKKIFIFLLIIFIFTISTISLANKEDNNTNTGLKNENGKLYYYENGTIQKKKWINVSNKRYYLTDSGEIKKNVLFSINNKKYYATSDGSVAVNTTKILKKIESSKVAKYTFGDDGEATSIVMNVPLISQKDNLPTGCELVSATMLMSYEKHTNYSDMEFYNDVNKNTGNPSTGYNGDPKKEGNIFCYPTAIVPLLQKKLGSAVDLTGKSESRIREYLMDGRPVCVWVSQLDGFNLHCICLTGYDSSGYYYNDPWFDSNGSDSYKKGYKNAKLDRETFLEKWKGHSFKAVSY